MKAKKTRKNEMLVTIATSAVCDFLKDEKKCMMNALNEDKVMRLTDYIHAVVDVWLEMKKKPDLYDFTREWVAKDYATMVGIGSVVKVLVGVPNSECKSVIFEY